MVDEALNPNPHVTIMPIPRSKVKVRGRSSSATRITELAKSGPERIKSAESLTFVVPVLPPLRNKAACLADPELPAAKMARLLAKMTELMKCVSAA